MGRDKPESDTVPRHQLNVAELNQKKKNNMHCTKGFI